MTMVDPGRFPNIVQALREAGLDPMTTARPGRPRQPLRDGRDRHRPRRQGARPPLRRRRVRLHRPARRQPARLELPQRVLRVRPPRGAEGARRGRAAATGETIEAEVGAPTRETRDAVWRLAGLERDAERLTQLTHDPYPLARLVAASALRARRRAARTAAPSSPRPTRPSTATTRSSTPAPRPRASRHGRTPDRLGRRPHDERARLVRRLRRAREGLPGEHGPRRLPRRRPPAPRRPRERHAAAAGVRAPTRASTSTSTPTTSPQRLMARRAARRAMRDAVRRFHDAGHPDRAREQLVARIGLRRPTRFDVVVLSQQLGIRKPDPRIYQVALERVELAAKSLRVRR